MFHIAMLVYWRVSIRDLNIYELYEIAQGKMGMMMYDGYGI